MVCTIWIGSKENPRGIGETQRALAVGHEESRCGHEAQIRPQEQSSVGTAKEYKLWKRSVCLNICFRDLSSSEHPLQIVEHVMRTAKDALDIFEIIDIVLSR